MFYEIIKYFVKFSEFCFYTVMNLINSALPKPSKEWVDGVIKNLSEEISVRFTKLLCFQIYLRWPHSLHSNI